jgi:hypothetical protein
LLFGRQEILDELRHDLDSEKSIRLILGDSGIGKSAILNEFYNILEKKNEVDDQRLFIGYFRHSDSLTDPRTLYPFTTALRDLLAWTKEKEQFNKKMKGIMIRVMTTTVEFAKSKSIELVGAILEDIAKKIGLENTYDVMRDYLQIYRMQKPKTAVYSAEEYLAAHKEEAVLVYAGIFGSLAKEFEDRKFILIFDNFESVGRASFNFLTDFISRLPARFHILVAYKTEEPNSPDSAAVVLYQEAERRLRKQNAKVSKLEGLKKDDIHEWIRSVKKTKPLPSHLQKVLNNSAGVPVVLEEWIGRPGALNYDAIGTTELCNSIIAKKKSLSVQYATFLDRMSILAYPIYDFGNLREFLNIPKNQFYQIIPQFLDDLNDKGLFEKKEDREWFKHDKYRKCLEEDLRNQFRKSYHNDAAIFYLKLLKRDKTMNTKLASAYHLHEAGRDEESYNLNSEVAKSCFMVGVLDQAERCYRTAIQDAKKLRDEKKEKDCIYRLARVLMMWNRYDEAYNYYKDLEEYFAKVEDVNFLPKVKFYLGLIHHYKVRLNEALSLYEESYSIAKQRGHKKGGQEIPDEKIEKELGLSEDYMEIPELYNDSLLFKKAIIWDLNIGATEFYIAYTHYIKGEIANALQWYIRSHHYGQSHGDQLGQAITLTQLAQIHHDQAKYDEALTVYHNLLHEIDNERDQMSKCLILFEIGGVYLYKNEYENALFYYSESEKIACELHDSMSRAVILHQKGNVHFKALNLIKALEAYHKSLEIKRNIEREYEEQQLHQVSKGVTNGQIGRTIMKSQYQANALQAVWIQNQSDALSYIWKAQNLFKNHNIFYYNMTQKDLQSIRDKLGDIEYERVLNEIKNHPLSE